MRQGRTRFAMFCILWLAAVAAGQTAPAPQSLSVPPDSPRWDLQGEAKVAEYQGRKSLLLDGGAAILKDFQMRDGVMDLAGSTPASRGFFAIHFQIRRACD